MSCDGNCQKKGCHGSEIGRCQRTVLGATRLASQVLFYHFAPRTSHPALPFLLAPGYWVLNPKEKGSLLAPFFFWNIMSFYEISSVAFFLMARLALRRPPAIRATKTVAAQKTMATTDSIVMNSNILSTSFRLQTRYHSGLVFSAFRLKATSFSLTSPPATMATTMVAATKTRAMIAIVSRNSIILITSLNFGPCVSFSDLVKILTSSMPHVKHFFEKKCTRYSYQHRTCY